MTKISSYVIVSFTIVKWIYDHNPESITQVNCNGKTPVDIAKENPYGNPTGKRIMEILTEYPFRFTTLETIMKGPDFNKNPRPY